MLEPELSIPVVRPTWWRPICVVFFATGLLELGIGLALVGFAFMQFEAMPFSEKLPAFIFSLVFLAVGAFMMKNAVQSYGAVSSTVKFFADEVHLPRVKTGESIPCRYEHIESVNWARVERYRLRLWIKTPAGTFWVHKWWLTPEWTLARVADEFKKRRATA